MNEKKYWLLFAQCVIVKGKKNIIICDLQRNDFYTINEGIYEILTKHKYQSIQEIKAYYGVEFSEYIDENMNYLIDNQLVFVTNNPHWFPEIKTNWSNPNKVTNAIVVTNKKKIQYLNSIVNQLEALGAFFIEFRILDKINDKYLIECLSIFEGRKIRNLNLNLIFNPNISHTFYKKILIQFQRIGLINIYSTPKKNKNELQPLVPDNVVFQSLDINYEKHCGAVSNKYFVSGLDLYLESQHYNSCLNRKISIDVDGNIKNCPSMARSYGNIKDTTLEEALNHPDFKQYWDITKDKIHVCKDCEFRYICTDCRAYIEDPEDIYSKPLKCGYNPYTGEWSEWSTNPLKQKAIEYYGMKDLVKKKE